MSSLRFARFCFNTLSKPISIAVVTGATLQTIYSDPKRLTLPTHGTIAQRTKQSTAESFSDGSLKVYIKQSQVREHTTKETGIWVTYGNSVYDITEFVEIHPGGERIMLAAGKAIDPFWNLFSIHQSPETKALLEQYKIGELDPNEVRVEDSTGMEALFANEPQRSEFLRVLAQRPFNAETAPQHLEKFITPNDVFYVRNHLPVPKIDPETYQLEIEGPGIPDGFSLSLQQLKELPKYSVTATLQCAGNRRKEMHQVKQVKGLQWSTGAISNAIWTGVRLRDVLQKAGYKDVPVDEEEVEHVCFEGGEGYGASIPAYKAFDPRGDVLLAYEMNGEELPKDHGFPVRAVVPGHVAARSVKWLTKISLGDEESMSHWQQRDYKGFSPSADVQVDYSKSKAIQELPVQSCVVVPPEGLLNQDGFTTLKGYAIAGGGRSIVRVDVSTDGGNTWKDAELHPPEQADHRTWAWTQWHLKVPVQKEMEIVCKAVDSAYNTQPETFQGIYNARGVLVSAWQRIKAKFD